MPQWDAHKTRETEEKKRLDEARSRLDALYAKRGRLEKFRTRAERDRYLRTEIASVEAYQRSQAQALQSAQLELQQAREALQRVEQADEDAKERAEDGKGKARQIGEDIAALKQRHGELTEKRKELWREETKYKSLVDAEADELRTAERSLASMMDKVSIIIRSTQPTLMAFVQDTGSGLRAVDQIAERLNLGGVYGPLYRLFEVTDDTQPFL